MTVYKRIAYPIIFALLMGACILFGHGRATDTITAIPVIACGCFCAWFLVAKGHRTPMYMLFVNTYVLINVVSGAYKDTSTVLTVFFYVALTVAYLAIWWQFGAFVPPFIETPIVNIKTRIKSELRWQAYKRSSLGTRLDRW